MASSPEYASPVSGSSSKTNNAKRLNYCEGKYAEKPRLCEKLYMIEGPLPEINVGQPERGR
jgi:hypothetical protein